MLQTDFDPVPGGWERLPDGGFIALIGPLWRRSVEGRLEFAFLAGERHLNRGGVIHGGMLLTFADHTIGMTCAAGNGFKPQVTISLDTQFIAAVQAGELVVAECELVRKTRSLLFGRTTIRVDDRICLIAHGVWKILEPR